MRGTFLIHWRTRLSPTPYFRPVFLIPSFEPHSATWTEKDKCEEHLQRNSRQRTIYVTSSLKFGEYERRQVDIRFRAASDDCDRSMALLPSMWNKIRDEDITDEWKRTFSVLARWTGTSPILMHSQKWHKTWPSGHKMAAHWSQVGKSKLVSLVPFYTMLHPYSTPRQNCYVINRFRRYLVCQLWIRFCYGWQVHQLDYPG